MKVTILGAGNAAQAMAGNLSLNGHEVCLWENPKLADNVKELCRRDRTLKLTGVIEGETRISAVTTDAKEALCGAEVIYCAMPSFGQESAFDNIIPFLAPGQSVLLTPGNFGSLSLYKRLAERGLHREVLVGESDTIPYAARVQPDGSVLIFGMKDTVFISAIPAARTDELISKLRPSFPVDFVALQDVLTVGLANTNMILHCPTMLMNTGRIESGERFRFYNDGMTESVCRVMEEMDAERVAVGASLGCHLITEYEDALLNYNLKRTAGARLYDIFHNHPVYGNHGPDSPSSMTNRYLSEDVPYLLVPLSEFGAVAGISTATVDAVIILAGAANGEDYRKIGRGLKKLGLAGLSINEIKEAVSG